MICKLLQLRGALSLLAALLSTSAALARPHVRRHFEPTDLELEAPGVAEIDLEAGFVKSPGPWRLVAPDFELDLGLLPWLELDLDGAYALEGADNQPFSLDHSAPDPLWPSLKAGVFDWADRGDTHTYALGVQAGPKLPPFVPHRGVGFEALILAGVGFHGTALALDVGGFVDPAADVGQHRPVAVEAGADFQKGIDAAKTWSVAARVGAVVFTSADPAQLQTAFGVSYAAARWLDLSLTAMLGFLPGGDRYGYTFGFAPHVPVWQPLTR